MKKLLCKVIGEFVCDWLDEMLPDYDPITKRFSYNNDWTESDWNSNDYCLSADEINAYGNGKWLYGWHISDLKIYDTPKELRAFKRWNKSFKNDRLTRPPQSWEYVEEL